MHRWTAAQRPFEVCSAGTPSSTEVAQKVQVFGAVPTPGESMWSLSSAVSDLAEEKPHPLSHERKEEVRLRVASCFINKPRALAAVACIF